MAKIINKVDYINNTNFFLHVADKGGTDIDIVVSGSTITLTTTVAAFATTQVADANGVINRGIVNGDIIKISHTSENGNEGVTASVSSVNDTSITATILTSPNGTPTAESAGSDINIVAFKKTIQHIEAGALSFVDGVSGIVVVAKIVDIWKDLNLDKYDKVSTSIEPRAKSIALLNGWEFHDQDTIDSIRDTAIEIRDSATSTARQIYALWRSGSLDEATDQFTFWPSSDAEMTAPTVAVMTGYINQPFLIYDASGADNRNSNGGITWITRCAEIGKTIIQQRHVVDYAEIIPVSAANAVDPKLQASDATIGAGGIYANIDITDATLPYSGDVDGVNYDFDLVIEGDNQLNQTVHEKVNYLLRQPTDINQSVDFQLRGDKQFPITEFSGEVFTVQGYLLNYNTAQRNDLRVVDINSITRSWPTIMTIAETAPTIAVGGTFTIWHTNTYGTDNAVVFQDESGAPQQDITIASSLGITMAYSTYNVDGHTAGTPLPLTLTYNRPGFIEPDKVEFIAAGENITVAISPAADPSYIA